MGALATAHWQCHCMATYLATASASVGVGGGGLWSVLTLQFSQTTYVTLLLQSVPATTLTCMLHTTHTQVPRTSYYYYVLDGGWRDCTERSGEWSTGHVTWRSLWSVHLRKWHTDTDQGAAAKSARARGGLQVQYC